MSTIDVYTVFGNALDNAIESVVEEREDEKRFISLKVSEHQKMVFTEIINYCGLNIEMRDSIPISTKENDGYHGFGVKSIQCIVEKYEGSMSIEVENQMFDLSIIIPKPQIL